MNCDFIWCGGTTCQIGGYCSFYDYGPDDSLSIYNIPITQYCQCKVTTTLQKPEIIIPSISPITTPLPTLSNTLAKDSNSISNLRSTISTSNANPIMDYNVIIIPIVLIGSLGILGLIFIYLYKMKQKKYMKDMNNYNIQIDEKNILKDIYSMYRLSDNTSPIGKNTSVLKTDTICL